MNDEMSYEEEAKIDELIEAFAKRIERDTEEMRRQLEAELEEQERRMIERWWQT